MTNKQNERDEAINIATRLLTQDRMRGRKTEILGELFDKGRKFALNAGQPEAVDGWYPVANGLPTSEDVYLVTFKWADEDVWYVDKFYFRPDTGWSLSFTELAERIVIAWMPLPPPYPSDFAARPQAVDGAETKRCSSVMPSVSFPVQCTLPADHGGSKHGGGGCEWQAVDAAKAVGQDGEAITQERQIMLDAAKVEGDVCKMCNEPESEHKPCPGCEACMFEGDGSCDHEFKPKGRSEAPDRDVIFKAAKQFCFESELPLGELSHDQVHRIMADFALDQLAKHSKQQDEGK